MKKIFLILFLLCFSVVNTAYAEIKAFPATCFEQGTNGPEIVSASKMDIVAQGIDSNFIIAINSKIEGLATLTQKTSNWNDCDKKWV